ncbi:MAG: tripartite tricarboxylate transporter substrate-binding protein [Candidatus Tectomicrobia bacterium]
MAKRYAVLLAALVWLALVATSVRAETAAEFYQGKTIRFIVGFSPGGGFDTYSRAIARHIGKHIPGHPSTVVENKRGAGSLIAANYMYLKAKPDGLTIGNWIGGLVLQQAMGGRAGIKFDARKFEWVGVPVTDHPVCALMRASGITSLDAWLAAKTPVKVGATAPGSSTDDIPRIVRVALELPLKLVEGYKGTAKIRLAAEGGEVAGGCWAWESVKVTWRRGIESGDVIPVLQINPQRHPELQDVPNAIELAKTDKARQLLTAGVHNTAAITRFYSLPPGTPKDRVKILQDAFMATMQDPEFLAEARQAKLDIDPKSGPEVKQIVAGFFDMDAALLATLREILVPKQ